MLLAIDTATRVVSLALHDGDQLLAETSWATGNNHTIELSPAIADLLGRVSVGPEDLTSLAVTLGPGSFTGLRIGMSVAKGLALASDPPLPIVGIPTLNVTAAGQPPLCERLIAVSQAGRGRINGCRFARQADQWVSEGDPFLSDWDSLLGGIEAETQVAGEIDTDGRAKLAQAAKAIRISSPALSLRRAGILAELAYERLRKADNFDAARLAPIYLRT